MRPFLKQIFASFIGTIVGVTLLLTLGAGGLLMLILAGIAVEEETGVKKKSVLVMDLSLNIQDTDPNSSFGDIVTRQQSNTITLRQVIQSLEQAAKDKHIVAILLDGSSSQGSPTGYATLQEVRFALQKFQAAGKKIIAYDVDWSEKEYYLGSVADTVLLNPMGALEINGMSSEQLFLAGALEKFGVGVQVIRVGKYKSAVEPFTQTSLSQENRQQTEKLLWSIWSDFLATVGKSRDKTPQELQQIAGQTGTLLPEEAIQKGLVDELVYFDEVVANLKQETGNRERDLSYNKVSLQDYADISLKASSAKFSDQRIAVLYAQGSIVGGEGSVSEIGSQRFAREIRKLRHNDDIKAVVLRINSPGGSATASEIILREIQLTKKEKPVVVSMGNVAASGGYWIATGADYIFAESSTITGSIGVFGLLFNVQEVANKNGVSWDIIKTTNLADLQTVVRPKTGQELELYQRFVNNVYNKFLDKVAAARKLPRQKVAEIAQGRVWSGEDAKQIGLVDEIGGIEAAINFAGEKASLETWQVEEYPQQKKLNVNNLLSQLLTQSNSQTEQNIDPLTEKFVELRSDLSSFNSFNDPKGIYTRLPFNFRVE